MHGSDDAKRPHDDNNRQDGKDHSPKREGSNACQDRNDQGNDVCQIKDKAGLGERSAVVEIQHESMGCFVSAEFDKGIFRKLAFYMVGGADRSKEGRAEEHDDTADLGVLIHVCRKGIIT